MCSRGLSLNDFRCPGRESELLGEAQAVPAATVAKAEALHRASSTQSTKCSPATLPLSRPPAWAANSLDSQSPVYISASGFCRSPRSFDGLLFASLSFSRPRQSGPHPAVQREQQQREHTPVRALLLARNSLSPRPAPLSGVLTECEFLA